MRISKVIVLVLLVSALALAVASQDVQEFYKTTVINDKISFDEKQDCTISYHNSTENIYGNVSRIRDTYTTCYNAPNQSYYQCVNGTENYQSYEVIGSQTVLKNNTNCGATKSYTISVQRKNDVKKYELDFPSWGACVQNVESDCLVVTCVSLNDGAHKGQFVDCKGGKSCQKFRICENDIKVYYKNSWDQFVDEDPTFYLNKLELKEVG